MPSFTYAGDEGRYYPTLGLTPTPGEAYELDQDPADGRWVSEVAIAPDPAPTTAAPAEPPTMSAPSIAPLLPIDGKDDSEGSDH